MFYRNRVAVQLQKNLDRVRLKRVASKSKNGTLGGYLISSHPSGLLIATKQLYVLIRIVFIYWISGSLLGELNLRMKYILDGQHAFTQNASSKHVFSQHASFQHTSTQHAYPSDKSVLGSQEWFLANYLLKYSSGKVTSWSCKCSILLGLFLCVKNDGSKKSQAKHTICDF